MFGYESPGPHRLPRARDRAAASRRSSPPDGNATQPESIATPKGPDAAVMKLWFALPSRSARPSVSVP